MNARTKLLIGGGVAAVVLVSGVAAYITRPNAAPTAATTPTSYARASAEAARHESACHNDQVQLIVGAEKKTGVIELLAHQADTDAMSVKPYAAGEHMCVPVADLRDLAAESGEGPDHALQVFVGYDPTGRVLRYRSQLDYDDLGGEQLELPTKPADLRFGQLEWRPGLRQVSVAWERALRSAKPARSDENGSEPQYTDEYQQCMNSGEAAEGVMPAMIDCVGYEIERQDAKLNRTYKAVMQRISSEQQSVLRDSERVWIKQRDATCERKSSVEAGGSMERLIYAQCVLEETAKRSEWLEHHQSR